LVSWLRDDHAHRSRDSRMGHDEFCDGQARILVNNTEQELRT
jgi:hypothetical protein